jgi:hypothetical protein
MPLGHAKPCRVPALHFVFDNFCWVHKTPGATPAMAAGLVERVRMPKSQTETLPDLGNHDGVADGVGGAFFAFRASGH